MSLKSRIEALILQISNAKTSLRSALPNKSVNITAVNTGRYNFSFTGYALKVGQSPVD